MKNNVLLLAPLALVFGTCGLLLPDGTLYLIAALMALAVLGGVQANRKSILRLTRWAKANPLKAQGLIAVAQIVLMVMGILTGYNLFELGFKFSDTTAYIFSALMILGFLALPFMPKRNTLTTPAEASRHRFAYVTVSLAALVLTAFFGNRIGDTNPNAPICKVIQSIDSTLFSDSTLAYFDFDKNRSGLTSVASPPLALAGGPELANLKITDPEAFNGASKNELKKTAKAAKKAQRQAKKELRKRLRLAAAGGSCGLAILIIILLIGPFCAGVCLFIFGVSGEISAAYALLGALIAAGSILGMVKVAKWCRGEGSS